MLLFKREKHRKHDGGGVRLQLKEVIKGNPFLNYFKTY